MALVENFNVYLSDFGVAVLLNSVAIRGIFDNGYSENFGMAGTKPSVLCLSSDVASAALGTAVVVNSINYSVVNIQPDGTGMTLLLLQET